MPSALEAARGRQGAPDDRFFRHIVSSLKNGVIAIRRDGTLALMNDEAYRIFALTAQPRTWAGRSARCFAIGLKWCVCSRAPSR